MLKKPNVVVVGGGTGLSNLLRGLKHFPVSLTAIVSVADNGGSTGILREDYDIPAPGDIRNVMVSMSKNESLIEEMFQYRFTEGNLKGHCLGNIMLTGMLNITGSMTQATKALSEVLDMYGDVIPVSNQSLQISAKLSNGENIKGECEMVERVKETGAKIEEIYYDEPALASNRATKAIRNADFIIFGIGSLYTSIAPNLAIKNIKDAVNKSSAEKIYVCNNMHQPGETEGYSVSDHVKAVEKHLKGKIDTVFANNNTNIPKDILQRYLDDNADTVEIDRQKLKEYTLIEKDLLKIDEDDRIRHNFLKLGMQLYAHILEKTS